MKKLTEITLEDFKELITSHKDELQTNTEGTRLINLATMIFKESNGDPKNNIFRHFSEIIKQISFHTSTFSHEDLSSLLSFIEYSNIKNDELIWSYLNLIKNEKDIIRKTMLLKIAFSCDNKLLSEEILYLYNDVKNKYPLFWIDLLFHNNQLHALKEMSIFLSKIAIPFSNVFPVINRWVRILKDDNVDAQLINIIISLKNCFSIEDQSIFQEWLDENGIYTENYYKIKLFRDKLQHETSHIINTSLK